MRIINFFLSILAIIYPFYLFFIEGVGKRYLFLTFALLWFIKATIIAFSEKPVESKLGQEGEHNLKDNISHNSVNGARAYGKLIQSYFSILDDFKLSLILSLIFFLLFFNVRLPIAYLYPTLINIFVFFIFFFGINNKPLILQLAEVEHKVRGLPPLNERQIEYTKHLNYVWCLLFATNAIITFIFSLEEDKAFWTLYSGVLVYIFTGLLFVGDRVYRKIRGI